MIEGMREIPVMSRAVLAGLLLLAACAAQTNVGVGHVLGFPGLGRQLETFYNARAWERNATCVLPRMTGILRADIVEERRDELSVRVRYSWRDFGRDGNRRGRAISRGGTTCQGIDERRFTLERVDDGVRVVAMSGPQRPRPIGGG